MKHEDIGEVVNKWEKTSDYGFSCHILKSIIAPLESLFTHQTQQ
jgi:hypothetical protein